MFVSSLPGRLSDLITKGVDLIGCFFLLTCFFVSYIYYFHYDDIYVPNGLIIEFYTDATPLSWVLFFGYFKRLKPWGKITLWCFLAMILINCYQIHIHFEENNFMLWIGTVFLCMLIGYAVCIANSWTEFINPNFYEND